MSDNNKPKIPPIGKRYRVVDTYTGAIALESDNIFPEPMTAEGYRFPSHKLGARMFADVDFPAAMVKTEIGAMTILAKRSMIAATNMLGYRQSGHIRAYTALEIIELAGYSLRQGRRFLPKMLRLRVMRQWQSEDCIQYYVNPAYFMANGKRLSLDLFLLFRDELTPLLPEWIMDSFLAQARDKAVLASDASVEAERITGGHD